MSSRLQALRDSAWELLENGLPVLLIAPNSKRPWGNNWRILTDPDQVESITDANLNLAVLLGEQSDPSRPNSPAVCVDFDGQEALARAGDYGISSREPSWITRTPSGGIHRYYRAVPGLKRRTRADGLPMDLLTNGYALVPPSRTEKGVYSWVPGHSPADLEFSEVYEPPGALLKLWCSDNEHKPPATEATTEKIASGSRNDTLTRLAGKLRRAGLSVEAIEAALLQENAARCVPPLSDSEVCNIAKSIGRYEAGQVVDLRLTEAGNAELLARWHGDILRFDHSRGLWLLWRGHWWEVDSDGEVYRIAKGAMRRLYQLAPDLPDKDFGARVSQWAFQSESHSRISNTLALAKNELPIADSGEGWDANKWLLGVGNGVLDLRTGTLRPGEPRDRITLHTPIEYRPEARAPRWEAFLTEAFDNDISLIDFIQRAVGYSLTGDVSEQVIFICHGRGSNGKGRFLTALRNVFGQYALNLPFSSLELDARSAMTNDLAQLPGKRLVTASETDPNTRLNEARIKALTGEDAITARFLYRENFTFTPVAHFWLAVNHKPRVQDDSYGFWRRVRLIPFEQQFIGRDADRELGAKLAREAEGILAWAVCGALRWQTEGLDPPAAVAAATEAYQQENDPLLNFLEDLCVIDPGRFTTSRALYAAYESWAKDSGIPERERLSSTKFGRLLGHRFRAGRDRAGNRGYEGIALTSSGGT